MEFTSVDTYQVTLDGSVDTIDSGPRGGSSVVLKSKSTNSIMYIGPATTEAGTALSSTTGFPLAAGETLALDLTLSGGNTAARKLSVKGTNNDILYVLVLKP